MNEITKNKSLKLGTVVRQSFLKTALIPILSVELVLLVLYFFSTNYITEKNLNLLRDNALETVEEMSKSEAKNFDDQLSEISRNNFSLQAEHQRIITRASPDYSYEDEFFVEKVGYELGRDLNPSGEASLYLSSKSKLNPRLREKIIKTRDMDILLKSLVDKNENLVTAYFISWDNMIRVYPAMEDFKQQFPNDFDLTEFNFYYLADKKHNPDRKSVWTDVYLDPAGKGWMLSNLVPIYQNGFLEGVTGLDVTLNSFSKHILSSDLQWNSGALVMDGDGNILTMSRAAESYLGLANDNDVDSLNNPEPTEFNLIQQNTLAGMYFSEFFNGTDKSIEFTIGGEDFLVTKQIIPQTGWQLFVMSPLKNVYGPFIAEKQQLIELGYKFLGLAAVFYFLFFIHLDRTSKKLANRVTKPIAKVAQMIMSYDSNDKAHAINKPVNITELDDLLSMNLKIQKAKTRYEKLSNEMKIKNEQLRVLAITDQLTQLYNRLKLDEVLSYELARSQRDKTPLTVAIIDIDKFKLVNDTYGHQAGDSVLIGVAQIMLRNIRSTDILGRWGGEEFLLIFPNTPIESASERADKLRQIIEEADFKPVKQVTISMGLASCPQFVCEKMLVELADNALYEAKENGRNRIELAPMVANIPNKQTDSEKVAS